MDKIEKNTKDYFVVDLAYIAKVVWEKIWFVIIASIVMAVIGFSVSAFLITPTYSSSVMLYVNNSSFTVGDLGFSISSSEISAAQRVLLKPTPCFSKTAQLLKRLLKQQMFHINGKIFII